MAAERDLARLLRGLRPELHPGRFVFTTVPGPVPPGLSPVVTVAEAEGRTLVLAQHEAVAAGLSYDYVAGCYHDHLFVPHDRAASAVAVLEALARRAQ